MNDPEGIVGMIYLLHFDKPYRHARHYLGWTGDIEQRLFNHRNGRGAKLPSVFLANDISFQVARLWVGTRGTERRLKNKGGASRHCPLCGVRPTLRTYPYELRQLAAVMNSVGMRQLQRDRLVSA